MSSTSSFRFAVTIMPREVILDTQGRAIEDSLRHQGISVNSVRVGKHVVLEVPGDMETAKNKVYKIAREMLHNPLLEDFVVEAL